MWRSLKPHSYFSVTVNYIQYYHKSHEVNIFLISQQFLIKYPACDVYTHESVAAYLGGSEFPLILALCSLQLLHFALQLLHFQYQILQRNQIQPSFRQTNTLYQLARVLQTEKASKSQELVNSTGTYACQHMNGRGMKHQAQTQCSYKKAPGLDRTVVNKGNMILLKQTPQSAVINRQEKDEPRTRLEGFQTTHLSADR